MAVSGAYAIQKLNGTNYLNWASDIKYLLIERGLWDILTEAKPDPVKPEYKSRSNVCLSIIYLNIESEYRKIIENCNEDPKVAWETLKKNFCPDSRASHMRLFTELMECRIKPRETIILYSSRLLRISNQILSLNPKWNVIYTCFQLLRYLPSHFDSIVQTILRWKEEDFIFTKIVDELCAEEVRLKVRDQDRGRSAAELQLVSFRKKVVTCWKCGKPGHVSPQCRNGNLDNQPKNDNTFGSYDRKTNQRQGNWSKGNSKSKSFKGKTQYKGGNASSFFISEASLTENLNSSSWLFDTGASHHFTCDKNLFLEFTPLKNENLVVAVKDLKFPIEGKGMIKLQFGKKIYQFNEVMYSSQLRRNLISGPRMDQRGAKFVGGNRQIKIYKDDIFQFRAYLRKGVYRLFPKIPQNFSRKSELTESLAVERSAERISLWHRRMGHISPSIMVNTSKNNCVKGLPDFKGERLNCEICKLSKFRRTSFKPTSDIRSKTSLELLFADVWGPCQVEGRNGEKYFLSIIDDFSRKVSLYPIQMKSDVPDVLMRHITRAENQLNKKVKCVRTDNGGEFTADCLEDFFTQKGIKHELTNAYTPEQNGVVERFNQTVADGIRTLLKDSGLDLNFWPEAATHFVHTWNRVCPKRLNKTPLELYTGKPPSVNHLKIFGSLAYVGVPKQRRRKLDLKATKGILVGYAFKTKGYRIWILDDNRIIETSNCTFNENINYGKIIQQNSSSGAVMGSIDYENLTFSKDNNESYIPNFDNSQLPSVEESQSQVPEQVPEIIWERRPVPRNDGSRTDIYYYEKGKTKRLRSHNEIEKYCSEKNIQFNPQIFDFSGGNDYKGLITNSGTKLDQPVVNLTQS